MPRCRCCRLQKMLRLAGVEAVQAEAVAAAILRQRDEDLYLSSELS